MGAVVVLEVTDLINSVYHRWRKGQVKSRKSEANKTNLSLSGSATAKGLNTMTNETFLPFL